MPLPPPPPRQFYSNSWTHKLHRAPLGWVDLHLFFLAATHKLCWWYVQKWREQFALYERVICFRIFLFTRLFPFLCTKQKSKSLFLVLLGLCKRRHSVPLLIKRATTANCILIRANRIFTLWLSKNEQYQRANSNPDIDVMRPKRKLYKIKEKLNVL